MAYFAQGELKAVAEAILTNEGGLGQVISALPSVEPEYEHLPIELAKAKQEEVARLQLENMGIGMKINSAALARNVGTTKKATVDQLGGWITRPNSMTAQDFNDWLSDHWEGAKMANLGLQQLMKLGVVQDLANLVADAGMQVFAGFGKAVPFIGWIISSAVEVGLVIRNVLQRQRALNFPYLYQPIAFRPDLDVQVYEDARRVLRQNYHDGYRPVDWTRLFLPTVNVEPIAQMSPFVGVLESDYTLTITPRSYPEWMPDPMCFGIMPGSGLVHQSIDLTAGSDVVETGRYLPSLAINVGPLWQRVMLSGPAMFTVNALELQKWDWYLVYLRQYLGFDARYSSKGRFAQKITDLVEFESWQKCRDAVGRSNCYDKDGKKGRGRRFGAFATRADAKKIIDHYADPALFGWANSEGWYLKYDSDGKLVKDREQNVDDDPAGMMHCTIRKGYLSLRERQFRALDTLLCAYVDDSYAAIAYDAELNEHWKMRKHQLLDDDDRCFIDLDAVATQVDGGIFKEQLIASGVGDVMCGGGYLKAREAKEGIDDPPEMEGVHIDPLIATPVGGRRAGGAGLLLAGAAALLLLKGRK